MIRKPATRAKDRRIPENAVYGRGGDSLLIHGSVGSRMLKTLRLDQKSLFLPI